MSKSRHAIVWSVLNALGTRGTNFIVSGAASKLRKVTDSSEPTNWNDGTTGGFLWVEIAGDTMTGEFYDEHAQLDYSDHISL